MLGIAASRLARKYVCPVILMNAQEEIAKGSCRSVNQINIHEVLSQTRDLLETFGGHAMAAGVSVKKENLVHLKGAVAAILAENYTEKAFKPVQKIDAIMDIADITPGTCQTD